MTTVAFIPARSGSKRTPGKNVRELSGHPLIAYTLTAARQSAVFDTVVVSTDSPEYAAIARQYGADRVIMRPPEFAGDLSPDIEWVEHTLSTVPCDVFSILRPTSPFRTAATIRRAMAEFMSDAWCDSLRAMERVRQHPGKMWDLSTGRGQARPLMQRTFAGRITQPWHSMPTQALPEYYVQNASLEIAHARVVTHGRTISGKHVRPFLTTGYEGLDINSEDDWLLAEALVSAGRAVLPEVRVVQLSQLPQ